MQKRYEIIVQEIGQEVLTVGRRWERGAGEDGEYGYAPEVESTENYTREIFRQTVAELDLAKLVTTINT